jgi:tetratricopeptide (TPR) repeat protein
MIARLAGLIAIPLLAVSPALAARGQVTASEMQGFGRLIFAFDVPVGAKLRTQNSVLIIEFDQSVTLDPDKLPVQVPAYIGIARLDPDGRSIRIGLNGRFKADLKQAGERVFLDLMGPRWQGMPPPLPQDVIDELVRRARVAEERARRADSERPQSRALDLRVAHAPRFRRAIFTMPRSAPVDFDDRNGEITLTFEGDFEIAESLVRSRLAGMAVGIEVEPGPSKLRIALRPAEGLRVRGFREDDSFTLDFSRADGQAMSEAPSAPAVATPVGAEPPRQAGPPAAVRPETLLPPSSGQPIDFRIEAGRDPQGFALRLAGLGQAPVAILQRGPTLMVLIETVQAPGAPSIPPELKQQIDGFQITRLREGVVLRMVPKLEGSFWLVRDGEELVIQRGKSEIAADVVGGQPIRLQRVFDGQGRDALEASFKGGGRLFTLEDPLSGGKLAVAPVPMGAFSSPKAQSFAEMLIERTLAGFAVLPLDEAVTIERRETGVLLSHEIRLNLSSMPAAETQPTKDRRALLIEPEQYDKLAREPLRLLERSLLRQAAEAPRVARPVARMKLAQAYLAHKSYAEAEGVLSVLSADDPQFGNQKNVLFARALASTFMGRFVEAARLLAEPQLAQEPEQRLLQAMVDSKSLRHPQAVAGFKAGMEALDRYPERLQGDFRRAAVEAAIEAGDPVFAREQILAYEQIDSSHRNSEVQQVLAGRLAELEGRAQDAFIAFSQAARSSDRRIEAEARFGRATSGLAAQKLTPEEAKAEFETLTAIWRRSETEVKALAKLGEIYSADGRWREAFLASQHATALLPNHPVARRLEEAMGRRFESIFLDAEEKKLSKVEALAIYQEFRTLVPPGRRGDEIARRLADRLFDLDLVNEASDILEHQVRNRLDGVARSVVATRLALMHLQNRQPLKALTMISETRLSSLPQELKRARSLLEARALGEVFRSELAIEILANETGDDVERLRADIRWKGKQWREAGEAYERVLGDAWQGEAALSNQQRLDVLRSGLAYVLAEEALSLDRLRSKYMAKMAKTDDAGAFNLIALENYSNPQGFREAARSIVNADTLTEFLAAYRKRYPEASGEARPARSAEQRQSSLGQEAPGRS